MTISTKMLELTEREKLTIRIALEEWKLRMAEANQAVGFVDPDDDGTPFSRTESLDKLINKLR